MRSDLDEVSGCSLASSDWLVPLAPASVECEGGPVRWGISDTFLDARQVLPPEIGCIRRASLLDAVVRDEGLSGGPSVA